MRLSRTLSLYIGRQFLTWLIAVFVALLFTVFLGDLAELWRRAAGKPSATFDLVLRMSLLKLPHLAQELLPFVILFASMLTFWRMTRNHELTVVRAAGVSVWQFLLPVVVVTLGVGVIKLAVLNPVAAAFYSGFERLEATTLRGRSSLLAVSGNGLWLREGDAQSNAVIHAQRLSSQEMELFDVMILTFQSQDRFVGRVDARSARLEPGHWQLRDAWINTAGQPPRFVSEHQVPTTLTQERIEDSFASPDTVSFWDLPQSIDTMETAGFSALRLRLQWYSLMAGPLVLFAMVLIAATFSLRPARRGGVAALAFFGVATGFALFFFTNLVVALGQTGSIPALLAAWSPAGIATLGGVSTLLHLEDG